MHAETDPTVEDGPASNGGATTLKKHDGQGNGSEMDASAHQSGRMSGKKTLDLWQSMTDGMSL